MAESGPQRRVVITGLGVISPLGNTPSALWDALDAGRSGVGPITSLPAGDSPVPFAAEAREFQGCIEDFGELPKEYQKVLRKALKVMCREIQMGVAAAQRALHSARLGPGSFDPPRMGVTFGSDCMFTEPEEFTASVRECLDPQGAFQFDAWAPRGMPKMPPLWLLKYLPNMPACHLAIFNDFRGPNNSLTLREAAANAALTEAFRTIVCGRADLMLVGATGSRVHPMKLIHTVQQEQLAPADSDPARASRPFDRARAGMVVGEGAGAVVLEELDSARKRGAAIHGEVLAGASSSVVGRDRIAQRGQAIRNAVAAALRRAGVRADDVGFVHAHGLSTQSSDAEEAWAIGQVFGGRAQPVPVTAAKSYFGNLGAGGGMIELIAGLMALEHDRLFPILNYETPDPQCPISAVTNGSLRPGSSFVNVNVTPQGQAAAVLVRRFDA